MYTSFGSYLHIMAASEITQSAQSAPHAQPPIERKASVELVEDTDAELGKKPGQVGGLEVLDYEIIEVSQEAVSAD